METVQTDTSASGSAADFLTDDEDDEFYDCNSESSSAEDEVVVEQPQGRLKRLDDLRLLNGEADLYIPVTQDPAPMTEDTLAEHAEVLTKYVTALYMSESD